LWSNISHILPCTDGHVLARWRSPVTVDSRYRDIVDVFLTTEHLMLRRFTADDVDNLVALDSDPGVMRFLTGTPTPREVFETETLPAFLSAGDADARFGCWAAEERANGAFVGWFQLRSPQWPLEPAGADDAELGYRLRTTAWGKGYGTEGSIALIHKAFADLGLARVVATTMAVNIGSRRVMEKAGLRHVRTFHVSFADPLPGTEHGEVEYALTREEWAAHPVGLAPAPA
jgi:RimJ/RimL family protein N-acetyltransferase